MALPSVKLVADKRRQMRTVVFFPESRRFLYFFVSFSSHSRSNRLHPLPRPDFSPNVKKMRKNAGGRETSALYSERFSVDSVLCCCPSRLISTLIQSDAGTSSPVHSSEQALIMSSEQVHDQSIFTFLPFFVCTRACLHA